MRFASSAALLALVCLAACPTQPKTPLTVSAPGVPERDSAVEARLREAARTRENEPAIRPHHVDDDGRPLFVNQLIEETSPYLLQHAHNPVDWVAWGDEAFERARAEDKPVFLSIGYSTCHWCHVMEQESFEDLEIAEFLNANFVCIKVDREERPDVDEVYMAAVQALTGRGGWPMTLVLTPDREPFFAGTYFPARDGDRGSRMGLLTLLGRIAVDWKGDRARLVATAGDLSRHLRAQAQPAPPAGVPDLSQARRVLGVLQRSFDTEHGGFGGAPKFPRPATLSFLTRYGVRTGEPEAVEMVRTTLNQMAAGGIHDQLGGAFHRYSVDAEWTVPHFEKMLYDNAQLVSAFVDAYAATGDPQLAAVARSTLDALEKDWLVPEGGLTSATDADSPAPDGERVEGWFFTWTPDELAALLTPGEAALATAVWGVRQRGQVDGRSVLTRAMSVADAAAANQVTPQVAEQRLEAARSALLAHRATRPPPLRDDKVITAWNGLALSAFAKAGSTLGEPSRVEVAESLARFLNDQLFDDDGTLHRTWRDGRARHPATLEDHAFVVAGLLDLHEATGDVQWLKRALVLQASQDALYSAPGGAWFRTPEGGEPLLLRTRPATDGAIPSGNGVAIDNVLRLHTWTHDPKWQQRADEALGALGGELDRGSAAPGLASAVLHRHDVPLEILVIHDEGQSPAALEHIARRAALPHRALLVGSVAEVTAHAELVPWVREKVPLDGPTAYVCERGICQAPTTDPDELARQLAARPTLPPAP